LKFPTKEEISVDRGDKEWTKAFLKGFTSPETSYYVDLDHPGWLVWAKKMTVHKADPSTTIEWDEIEVTKRSQIGALINRAWYHALCQHLLQEPKEGGADRFRMASPMLLQFVFELMQEGTTVLTLQDVIDETNIMFGDGSDKHQHRATAEVFGSLIMSSRDLTAEKQQEIWNYTFPIISEVFEEGLNPENLSYWSSFLHLVLVCTLPLTRQDYP